MYAWLIKPLLFQLPPEAAHAVAMTCLRWAARLPGVLGILRRTLGRADPILTTRVAGLTLASPVGLAAGLDKNAEAFAGFCALGFGFVEVGTLTPKAQPGSERPRLFRLPLDRALVNRMGFNNCGAPAAAARLARREPQEVVGANIGKNRSTELDAALGDYVASTECLAPWASYVVVNVSSPNTPSLRALQAVEKLRPLLLAVKERLQAPRRVPLFVKIAPDLSDEEIDAIADLAVDLGIDGIIATNTTTSREGLRSPQSLVERCGAGGLSGAPLAARSLEVLRRLHQRVGGRIALVSVGGIEGAEDAWQRIRHGATLVQVYTALIYEGPGLIARLNRGLAERARRAGFKSIQEAVGSAAIPAERRPEVTSGLQ